MPMMSVGHTILNFMILFSGMLHKNLLALKASLPFKFVFGVTLFSKVISFQFCLAQIVSMAERPT